MERFAYEISWYTRISALTFLVCESAKMEVGPAEHTYIRIHHPRCALMWIRTPLRPYAGRTIFVTLYWDEHVVVATFTHAVTQDRNILRNGT